MGDAYRNRQPQLPQSAGLLKPPDIPQSGMPSAHEVHHYLGRNDDREGPRVVDTQSIGSTYDRGVLRVVETHSIGFAYDRYLQSLELSSLPVGEANNYKGVGLARAGGGGELSSLPVGEANNYKGVGLARAGGDGELSSPPVGKANNYKGVGLARAGGGGVLALPVRDPLPSARGTELAPNEKAMVFTGKLPVESIPRPRGTLSLPPDASSTLYIEGLPSDSSRREVAHIFRPFVGYKEVRLVRKESKHRGGDPLILCFVDFVDPACAATALSALQGYKMDEHDHDSAYLKLQFSKFPGPRSGSSGSRGKR